MKNIVSESFRLLLVLGGLILAGGNVCAQEMYAVLQDSTATFYYDNSREGKVGKIFPITNGNKIFPKLTDKLFVKKIIIDPSFADARPTSTAYWFYDLNHLEVITGMEYLNTEDVTDMKDMFYVCEGLTSLDLSNFNTSKLESMYAIFKGCTSMTVLDVSNFDTSNVSSMLSIFANCESLTTIYGNDWDTSKVAGNTDWDQSRWIFNYCYSLVGGKGTRFNMTTVDDYSYARIDRGEAAPGYFTEKNPTGISEVADRPNTSSVYNLQGYRLLGTPQKGLYIRNGKKCSF